MPSNTSIAVEDCATAITRYFQALHSMVQTWSTSVQETFIEHAPLKQPLDLQIESLVRPALAQYRESIIGAGFVAAPGLLKDAPWHLAWWLGERNTFEVSAEQPQIRSLLTVDDPEADGFRDYTSLEWWRIPVTTGRMHITGPYVDYLCTDDYTMTMTLPVSADERLLGVVGADQYVTDIERELLPLMLETGHALTLTNAHGRVVLSTDFTLPTGTLLRGEQFPAEALAAMNDDSNVSVQHLGDTTIWRCGDSTLYLLETR